MSLRQHSDRENSLGDRPDWEKSVSQFADAWARGVQPRLDDFLPAPAADRWTVLGELVRVDLEYRLKRNEPARIESYLERYPELARTPAAVIELIQAEYALRRQMDPALARTEYQRRFPQHPEAIVAFPTDAPPVGRDGPASTEERPADPALQSTQDQPRDSDGISTVPAAPGPRDVTAVHIPGYQIERVLGEGGMGIVYLARQISLKRLVALKMILAGGGAHSEQRARFQSEAQAVARLQHPNIVQIYEIGEHEGRPYFSMEFVDGGSLSKRLGRRPLPPAAAAELTATLARAMHYCHQRGIVHRDLKPGNILLVSVESSKTTHDTPLTTHQPKITDFGLAKQLEEDGLTVTGAVMGTPSYMAPEQADGDSRRIGPATDVYSLGAILYEMLTGQPPFKGSTVMETLQQVRHQEPLSPSRRQPGVPCDLETICLKALTKESERRYSSALLLAQDLERFNTGEAILARREGPLGKLWRAVRRSPRVAAILTMLVLLVSVVGWLATAVHGERRTARLSAALADELNALEWSPQQLETADALIADLERLAPDRAAAAQQDHNRRLAGYIEAQLERGKLDPDDVKHIDESLRLLEGRDSALASNLRAKREERYRKWETRFVLGAPFTNRRQILAVPDMQVEPSALYRPPRAATLPADPTYSPTVLTQVACRGSVELEAVFEDWVGASQVGIYLNAGGGHTAAVNAVVFSPTARVFASGSDDGTIRLWDAATGAELATLRGHTAPVLSLAFSPDGTLLASGSGDKTIKLWNVADRHPRSTLQGHTGGVTALAFTTDGRTLASGSGPFQQQSEVILWDPASGDERRRWAGPPSGMHSLAFAPDGRTLAGGGVFQGTAQLWDAATGTERTVLRVVGGMVSVAFTPDGQTLATGSTDGQVTLWDLPAGKVRAALQGNRAGVYSVAVTANGRALAAGYDNACVILWDLATGNQRALLRGRHAHRVQTVAIGPDSDTIASGDQGGQLTVWNGTTFQPKFDLSQRSYSFLLSALPRSAAGPVNQTMKDEPVTFASVRRAGDFHYLQIFRNDVLQREARVRLPVGPVRLRASRQGSQIFLQVHDQPPVAFFDALSGHVPPAGVYGLYWPRGVRLTRLRGSCQVLPPAASPLERGDDLYAKREFDDALAYYQEQAVQSGRDPAIRQEADFKAALCLLGLQRFVEADTLLERVAAQPGKRWPLLAVFHLWLLRMQRDRINEAEQVLEQVVRRYRFEEIATGVPEDVRLKILSAYAALGGAVEMIAFDPRIVGHLERAVHLACFFEAPADLRLQFQLRLLRAHGMAGQDVQALAVARELLQTLPPSAQSAVGIDAVEDNAWLLRRNGDARTALAEVDRWLYEAPATYRPGQESSGYRLLVERARIHAALKEWDLAEQDLAEFFRLLPSASVPYDPYAAACLLQGVLRERRGDTAGAQEAWRRGLKSYWLANVPIKPQSFMDADRERPGAFLHLMLGSLTEQLTEAEAQQWLNKLTAVTGASSVTAQMIGSFRGLPAVMRQMWRTPRGRACAHKIAYRDLSFSDYIRFPMLLATAETLHQGAIHADLSAEQDLLIWNLVDKQVGLYFAGKLNQAQLLQLGLAWTKGISGLFGWAGAAPGLDPSVRGPTAYLLGHRFERVFKKPDEAAALFRTALDDAPPDSPLRRLAQTELDRMKPK